MRLVRLLLLSALVLVLCGVASAGAEKPQGGKAKPEFTPKTGDYTGTMTTSYGTTPVTGKVVKSGKKYLVQVFISTIAKCVDGTTANAGVVIPAQVKGKSFSATETGTDFSGGTATYKLSGAFSSVKAFAGTASKNVVADTSRPESKSCGTGKISFSLKKK